MTQRQPIGTLEGSAFLVAAGSVLLAALEVVLVQPRFLKMFAEFGGELPILTRLALSPVVMLVLGLLPAVLAGLAMLAKPGANTRVAMLVASLILSLTTALGFVVAMYLPLFRVAEAIR